MVMGHLVAERWASSAVVRAITLNWTLFAVRKWPTAKPESPLALKSCWSSETSRSPIFCASPRPRFPRDHMRCLNSSSFHRQTTGWGRTVIPGPSSGTYSKAGSSSTRGQEPREIVAGEAFWEPGGDVVHYQVANLDG